MKSKDLLKLLKPDLEDELAEAAGSLLDPVAAHLKASGYTRLFDIPPAFVFDPVAASSFLPDPVCLPEIQNGKQLSPQTQEDPEWNDPIDLSKRIISAELGMQDVLDRFVKRISKWNPIINAFTSVTLDAGYTQSAAGTLAGVPIGVQDMICTRGVPTAGGSRILKGFIPDYDATAWKQLYDEGAVLAGKLTTQEFAAGTTGENDWFGPTRNPWDLARHAGGAAGGAGAAVAAGLVSAAIATDPGGSLRVPAAHCGVVGLKPTFGSIDRFGSIPLTWTTEAIGPLARTVIGTAQISDLLLNDRAFKLYGQSCTSAAQSGKSASKVPLRVGIPPRWLAMGLDSGVKNAFENALDLLKSLGVEIIEVDLPDLDSMAPVHRAIAFSEASSIHEEFILTRPEEYGDIIRDRQEAGRGVLASEYLKAWRLRGGFARQFSEAWRLVDVIVTPTSPVPAAVIGTLKVSTGSRGLEAVHTVYTRYAAPTSAMGLPSLSVPCGFTSDDLPVGIQFFGPPHSEPLLFYIASSYEAATSWVDRHPVYPGDQV